MGISVCSMAKYVFLAVLRALDCEQNLERGCRFTYVAKDVVVENV